MKCFKCIHEAIHFIKMDVNSIMYASLCDKHWGEDSEITDIDQYRDPKLQISKDEYITRFVMEEGIFLGWIK